MRNGLHWGAWVAVLIGELFFLASRMRGFFLAGVYAMSRPKEYGSEMTALILGRLAAGESLTGICRDPDMPGMTTVLRWLAGDEAFRREYQIAREAQADAIFEELLSIADDVSQDWVESTSKTAKEGSYKLDHEHVTRSRLRIDTRKWVLARMSPRKYGDAVSLRHGGDAANPLTVLLAQVQGSSIGVADEAEEQVVRLTEQNNEESNEHDEESGDEC